MSTPNNGWQGGGGWGPPQPGSGPAGGGWGANSPQGGGWGAQPTPPQPAPPQPQPAQPQPAQSYSPAPETQSYGGATSPTPPSYGPGSQGGSTAASSSAGDFTTTSAPHLMLLPSLILAAVSLILCAVVGFGPLRSIDTGWGVFSGIAWALSGIVGVSALGLYFTKNTEARAAGMYEYVGWKQGLFYATVAALVIAVVVSSIMFALWFGKL